jgi:HK97 family phage major capsid protein
MSKALYQQKLAKIGELNETVKTTFDRADADGGRALTADELKTVRESNKQIEQLEHEAKELMEAEGIRSAAERRAQEQGQGVNRLGAPKGGDEGKADRKAPARPLGAQVLEDEEFKAWLQKVAPGGASITRAQFGNSPAVQMKTLITASSVTSAGALIVEDRTNIVDQGTFYRPLTILDLITRGTTDSDLVEWVEQGTHTNNAAPVAEATASSGSSGAKPESAMALAVKTSAVKTIAHWIPATRRALQDAAGLRTLIDGFLRYGLMEEMEDQVMSGDGVGENFLGVRNYTGIQTQAYDTSILVTARKARTKVSLGGRTAPTAYVMHPNDWQAFDLLLDGENRYYFGGPSVIGAPRLWGLPVVESEASTEGEAHVANWRFAALWQRMAAQILVSDSHADFFVRNLIAILAEERAAFGIIRPSAFVEIDLTA